MDFTSAFGGSNGTGKPPGGIDGFDGADPAPEFSPVPAGVYVARAQRGEYTTTRAGAEAYRMRFEITEGPQAGRTLVRTWTFGEKAMTEPGLDVGLPPKEVERQIVCGVAHARRQRGEVEAPPQNPHNPESPTDHDDSHPLPPGATDFPFGALAHAGAEGVPA
jgi:hypothetical protein